MAGRSRAGRSRDGPAPALAALAARARARGSRVALADGDDARAVEAGSRLRALGIEAVLLRRDDELPPSEAVQLVEALLLSQRHRGLTMAGAMGQVRDPLYRGAAMLRSGLVDACVAGATRTTGEVVRAAIRVVGLAPGRSLVSSSFLMQLPGGRLIGYGDCGIVARPDPEQLAQIAVETGRTYETLTGTSPVVAMLSFSTKGSADHEEVRRVRTATELARELDPGLEVDGELQFDAAWVAEIGACKAPGSTVPGRANVFVFPNLDAGNIAYKLTERLAGAQAYGPLLQGLARPMHDLSRGSTADDMVAVAVIAAGQAAA